MKNKDRKKQQRAVNKFVRNMNRAIENDNLWLGRFYAHQVRSDYIKYDDNSGGFLVVYLEFVDRKTGFTKTHRFERYGTDPFLISDLFWAMNGFIVEDCQVWEKEKPYQEIIDYRKGKKNA